MLSSNLNPFASCSYVHDDLRRRTSRPDRAHTHRLSDPKQQHKKQAANVIGVNWVTAISILVYWEKHLLSLHKKFEDILVPPDPLSTRCHVNISSQHERTEHQAPHNKQRMSKKLMLGNMRIIDDGAVVKASCYTEYFILCLYLISFFFLHILLNFPTVFILF